jgi:hypothetical protein
MMSALTHYVQIIYMCLPQAILPRAERYRQGGCRSSFLLTIGNTKAANAGEQLTMGCLILTKCPEIEIEQGLQTPRDT